jgi:hypothetical protein
MTAHLDSDCGRGAVIGFGEWPLAQKAGADEVDCCSAQGNAGGDEQAYKGIFAEDEQV